MAEFFKKLFDTDFMPHGHCYYWQPDVVWLHVISNIIIAVAYYSIPFFLIYLVRKRKDMRFKYMFLLFGLFIFFCGTTHVLDIYTLWNPVYRLEGLVKAGTALISVVTGIMLIPMLPRVLNLPSPDAMAAVNEEFRLAKQTLEQRVEERTEQLNFKNRELREFAYIVSHDLKSPLRAIGSLSDLLSLDYNDKLDAEGKEYLRLIKQRIVKMDSLINSVLHYSKVGQVDSVTEKVAVTNLVNEVINELDPPSNISFDIASPLPVLEIEKMPVYQVFLNLLGNAIKYNNKKEGLIRISAEKINGFYQFTVEDNGIGIEKIQQDKVFEMFRTIQPEDGDGSGIGLSIVRKVVNMYGGKIWIESEPDIFTKFHFTLPEKHEP